jgi:hypothetical protein
MAKVCKKLRLRSKVPHASPDLQQAGFDPESFFVAHGIQLLYSMNVYKKRFSFVLRQIRNSRMKLLLFLVLEIFHEVVKQQVVH